MNKKTVNALSAIAILNDFPARSERFDLRRPAGVAKGVVTPETTPHRGARTGRRK